ncbi:MAG TPA: YdeI/OmpD-associated family protein [Anaerolineae bacterium]|nr:YdeI/OmpD-associated family protein [Anaerolineae bacterium]
MKPTFFKSADEFRQWLAQHHAQAQELWVGFYKTKSGKGGITYQEALDQALCYGWIDAIRKSIDDTRYTIRFVPRKPKSIWSVVNTKRVGELTKLGLMQPSGLKVFEERDLKQTKKYSFEQSNPQLDAASAKKLKANEKAWEFFQSQAPTYQRAANWWVISAKKEETRAKRLEKLIQDSENGKRLAHLTYTPKAKVKT